MTCQRCGSDRLFQFEASKDSRAQVENLPLVCRGCGLITIAGQAVTFPPELEAAAKTLAEAAEEAGKQAVKDLTQHPDQAIAGYFSRVYRTAYMDGFWRALLFARHNQKEGRLKRLRELWRGFVAFEEIRTSPTATVMTLKVDGAVYDEFKQLLELGDTDAPRLSHTDSPVPDGKASVPR